MGKRPNRWTASYAGRILDEADRAESDRSYAARRGIKAQRLTWWRSRLERPRRERTRGTEAGFVELKARPATPTTVVEVLLLNGRQLRISDQADAAAIARLADALERC